MRRALPLALAIVCACRASSAPAPAPVAHEAKPKPHPLGLEDGAIWRFTGSYTWVGGTRPIEVATVITRVDADRFTATAWPAYDEKRGIETEIRIDDGVVLIDETPWIRIEPAIESLPCPDGEYCWTVEPDAAGGFDIYYRTRPDTTVYHLVPGRGITDFLYQHNGFPPDTLELHRD